MSTRSRALRRDRLIVAVAGVVALLGFGGGVWHGATASPPTPQVTATSVPIDPGAPATIAFGGDTMLGDGMDATIGARGMSYVLAGLAPLLRDSDYTIVNAEGPLTRRTPQRGKRFQYAAGPASARALADIGVDALGLGNNHTMDAGPLGLADTLVHAKAAGLTPVGAGSSEAVAERPLLLTLGDRRIGVVVLSEYYGKDSRATESTPGSITFSPASVQRGVDLARAAGADQVVAFVHWGDNYTPVTDRQRYWADMLVRAGYDLVIGSGSHTAQPVQVIQGVPVVWDLGNFAFGSPGRFDSFGVPGRGTLARVTWHPDGSRSIDLTCLVTDNAVVAFQARQCSAAEATAYAVHLGPAVVPTPTGARLRF